MPFGRGLFGANAEPIGDCRINDVNQAAEKRLNLRHWANCNNCRQRDMPYFYLHFIHKHDRITTIVRDHKTNLIKELLNNWGKVNLFTRPRRFGKSLSMSILRYFFGYGCESALFDGLAIAEERESCEKYMGKFPVFSINLKGVNARDCK